MAETNPAPSAGATGKFWIFAAFAGICVTALVLLVGGWLLGGPRDAAEEPGTILVTNTGADALPQNILTEPPRMSVRPLTVDFGHVRYDSQRNEPVLRTIEIRYAGGNRAPVVFSEPYIDTKGRDHAIKIRELGNDCYAGVQHVNNDNAYCTVQIEWGPKPGETIDAAFRTSVGPDTSMFQGREIPDLWDNFVLEATLVGRAEHEPPVEPLRASPTRVDLGEIEPGDASTQRFELGVAYRSVEIVNVEWREKASESIVLQWQSCREPIEIDPANERGSCEMKLVWTPRLGEGDFDNEIWVDWRYRQGILAAAHTGTRRLQIPVSGAIPRKRRHAAGTVWLDAKPEATEFGTIKAQFEGETFTRRIVLTAGPEPVSVESVDVFADMSGLVANVRIDSECQSAKIIAEEFCELRVNWTPTAPSILKSEMHVEYRVEGRKRLLTIPIAGRMLARARISSPNRRKLLMEQARRELQRRRALPTLLDGVGVLRGKPRKTGPAELPAGSVDPRSVWDEDYRSVGFDPMVSSRPVRLNAMIPAGTPVPVTLTRTFDARMVNPIEGTVDRDVYAPHGRNPIIERGDELSGRSVAFRATATSANLQALAGMVTGHQGRIQVEWNVLRRTDGSVFNLKGVTATGDRMGRSGVPGHIDIREIERYAGALMRGGMTALATMLLGHDQTGTRYSQTGGEGSGVVREETVLTREQIAWQAVFDELVQVQNELRFLTVPVPTITVPPGTRVTVTPTRDLWLRPARGHLAPQWPAPGAGQEPAPPTDEDEVPPDPNRTTAPMLPGHGEPGERPRGSADLTDYDTQGQAPARDPGALPAWMREAVPSDPPPATHDAPTGEDAAPQTVPGPPRIPAFEPAAPPGYRNQAPWEAGG